MRCFWSLLLLLALAGCASFEGARLYGSGSAALDRGDSARAIADFERAAELVPQASEVQNHLGIAYLSTGRTDEARTAFERALELDCENGAARHNLRALELRAAEQRAEARPAGEAAGAP